MNEPERPALIDPPAELSPNDPTDPIDPIDPTPAERRLRRFQTAATAMAVVGLLLGFLASLEILLFPRPPLAWAYGLQPVMLALGVAGGAAAALRGRHADRVRWATVAEPLLTDLERETAHKDAEAERRWAGVWFLLGPMLLGYWLAYQVAPPQSNSLAAYLLAMLPMLGFLIGLLAANRRLGPDGPPEGLYPPEEL